MMPSLSIVIPVFNEPYWLPIAVADVVAAQQASPFAEAELVIVDDGSNEATREAIRNLEAPIPIHVIHQENAGRHVARGQGIRHARGDLVLLIDSRVSIRPDALRFVGEGLQDGEPLPIWNAHVDIDLQNNPYARFWNVLTENATHQERKHEDGKDWRNDRPYKSENRILVSNLQLAGDEHLKQKSEAPKFTQFIDHSAGSTSRCRFRMGLSC